MSDPMDFDGILFHPVTDYFLGYLKPLEDGIPGLKVRNSIEDQTFTTPYVLISSGTAAWVDSGNSNEDTRFVRRALLDVQTFTDDPDGDDKAQWLHEIVRARLYTVWRRQEVLPGIGHLGYFRTVSKPRPVTDWATSQGSNQYANLPEGSSRWQAKYGVSVRPAKNAATSVEDAIAIITA